MIAIRIELDTVPVERQLTALERDQLPFATSLALNNLGKLAQSRIRTHYRDVFELRRAEFIEKQGAKIFQFATKRDPVLVLGIDPKADFLEKFETGGPRPKRGTHIAIPVQAKRNRRDIITRGQRPRPLIQRLGGRKGAGGVFVLREDAGRRPAGLYQRFGRGGARIRLLYAFERQAQIPASLRFVQIATQTAEDEWASEFEKALAQALRTAR